LMMVSAIPEDSSRRFQQAFSMVPARHNTVSRPAVEPAVLRWLHCSGGTVRR
jgi:hypothetical protein